MPLKTIEHQHHKVIVTHGSLGKNVFTADKRRELAGDSHAGWLMADDAVLRIETLADNFRINRSGSLDPTPCPIHGIGFVDILTETAAVKAQIESSPA